jgi:hypothetical protein
MPTAAVVTVVDRYHERCQTRHSDRVIASYETRRSRERCVETREELSYHHQISSLHAPSGVRGLRVVVQGDAAWQFTSMMRVIIAVALIRRVLS